MQIKINSYQCHKMKKIPDAPHWNLFCLKQFVKL